MKKHYVEKNGVNDILYEENDLVRPDIDSNDKNQYVSGEQYVPIEHEALDSFINSTINPNYIGVKFDLDDDHDYNIL